MQRLPNDWLSVGVHGCNPHGVDDETTLEWSPVWLADLNSEAISGLKTLPTHYNLGINKNLWHNFSPSSNMSANIFLWIYVKKILILDSDHPSWILVWSIGIFHMPEKIMKGFLFIVCLENTVKFPRNFSFQTGCTHTVNLAITAFKEQWLCVTPKSTTGDFEWSSTPASWPAILTE